MPKNDEIKAILVRYTLALNLISFFSFLQIGKIDLCLLHNNSINFWRWVSCERHFACQEGPRNKAIFESRNKALFSRRRDEDK